MSDLDEFFRRLRRGEWDLPGEGPPVDDAVLRRYIGRELSADDARAVSLLIVSYPPWRDRYATLIIGGAC